MANKIHSISPLDGRYKNSVKDLSVYFSESALMQYRLKVEIEYLIALGNAKSIKDLPPFSNEEQIQLRKIYQNFKAAGAEKVKAIEATTNHDVKAIEYYIQSKTKKALHPWTHFALTSEDVNNLSYSLMWRDGLKEVYLPALKNVNGGLKKLTRRHKELPMLALTHGQPATPTSLGKEMAVFVNRLERQTAQLKSHKLQGKLSGATGTWGAHAVAYPKVNWLAFTKRFVRSLGLEPNLITTQIESNDSLAEAYHILIRINTILLDLCRDMWLYISRGVFRQKTKRGEIGSSTMPHKVNPIHFENAEGNLGVANSYFAHLAQTLPVSRLQRDLSGSTVIRNQGVPLAHSLLACKNILKGLDRLAADKVTIAAELDAHWEVLAEAIQTVLRKAGKPEAYEQLKEMTRGQPITQEFIQEFISKLKISSEDRAALLNLTPADYTGLASKLVDLI
ncbi:MAG: adenylosuccinate lyase [Candidatus Marinimicrobia bacterium]|nr:adenylosuccinate lyase [Candidatus Neomarinimicrobiota bacterium]MDP6965705.1 adenylosuccinate lyase [Candidatus Neomarinimicrobiota bacterium]